MNPRARRDLHVVPAAQRAAMSTLEHVAVCVREIARLLDEAADGDGAGPRLNDWFRPRFAEVLRSVAAAASAYGDPSRTPDAAAESAPLAVAVRQLEQLQEELSSWERPGLRALLAEGALLTQVGRIVRDLHSGPTHARR